jgi:hypothetical protein
MMLSSLITGAFGYFVAAPFYLQKTKLQGLHGIVDWRGKGGPAYLTGHYTGQSLQFQHLSQSVRATTRASGILGLWKGTGVLVVRGACLTMGQLTGYDYSKMLGKESSLEDGPVLHVVASVASAFWAATLSLPLDVLMARYQVASPDIRALGPWGCAGHVLKTEGGAVFLRGWTPMFARLAPMYILGNTLFEQIRRLMGRTYYD